MALTDDLKAYWTMDDGAGTTAIDSLGAHNLTVNNSWAAGVLSNCNRTDGTDIANTGINPSTFATKELTFNFWIKTDGSTPTGYMMGLLNSGSEAAVGFYSTATSATTLKMFIYNGGGADEMVANNCLSSSVWHMVTWTFANGHQQAYVDGSASGGEITAAFTNFQNLNIAAFDFQAAGGSALNHAYIDEFGIWGRKLTEAEITTLYNDGAGTQYPFTVDQKTSINVGDVWKDVEDIKIQVNDAWKEVAAAKINIGDSWKTIF